MYILLINVLSPLHLIRSLSETVGSSCSGVHQGSPSVDLNL